MCMYVPRVVSVQWLADKEAAVMEGLSLLALVELEDISNLYII